MSGAKKTGQALGGVAVILLNLALQISGYQSPFVAFILVVIAVFLLLPWLNEKRKVVLNTGKQAYGEYGKAMVITVLTAALCGALLFGALAWLGWRMFNPHSVDTNPKILTTEQGDVITNEHGDAITAESRGAPPPQPPRHINTFTPQEIREQLEQAGPLERDDVAEQFRHGIAEWTLVFEEVVRHRGTNIMLVRFLPVNSPWPRINCPEIALEGNAYLGRIKPPTRFRVKGVIADVDRNAITLNEASFEQLHDAIPSPTPLREQGPRVVPPQNPAVAPTPSNSKERADKTIQTVEARMKEINDVMEKQGPLLDFLAENNSLPITKGPDVPKLWKSMPSYFRNASRLKKKRDG